MELQPAVRGAGRGRGEVAAMSCSLASPRAPEPGPAVKATAHLVMASPADSPAPPAASRQKLELQRCSQGHRAHAHPPTRRAHSDRRPPQCLPTPPSSTSRPPSSPSCAPPSPTRRPSASMSQRARATSAPCAPSTTCSPAQTAAPASLSRTAQRRLLASRQRSIGRRSGRCWASTTMCLWTTASATGKGRARTAG